MSSRCERQELIANDGPARDAPQREAYEFAGGESRHGEAEKAGPAMTTLSRYQKRRG